MVLDMDFMEWTICQYKYEAEGFMTGSHCVLRDKHLFGSLEIPSENSY